MAQIQDLDDYGIAQSKHELHWTGEEHLASSDWTLILSDVKKEFRIHLKALAPNSLFFDKIYVGSMPVEENDEFRGSLTECTGNLKIKSATGAEFRSGNVNDTVQDLKSQIHSQHGIAEYRQRLFRKDQKELDQGWRKLADYGANRGDTLQLVLREPWQRSDLQNRKTVFNLPKLAADAFEVMLDFMYAQYNEPQKVQALNSSPETLLGLIWLSGPDKLAQRLLGMEALKCIQSHLNNSTAHEYMAPAYSLGLEKIYAAAFRLAQTFITQIPIGALNMLTTVNFANFLRGIDHGSNTTAMQAKNRAIAAYIRASDDSDVLGADGYRLVASELVEHNGSEVLPPADLVIILQKAIKYQDRKLQDTCIPLAAKNFTMLQKQDLQLLPTTTMVELLSMDSLAVVSEDDVVADAEAYVARQGGSLSLQDEQSLWSCCRFAYCSSTAQETLQNVCLKFPDLAQSYLGGVVARNSFRPGVTPQTRPRTIEQKSKYRFGRLCSERLMLSADGTSMVNSGRSDTAWEGGILEPAIATTGRKYLEMKLESIDSGYNLSVGVVALSKDQRVASYRSPTYSSPLKAGAFTFHCGGVYWTPLTTGRWGSSGCCSQGSLLGLLVENRRLDVLVNGRTLGTVASDLPDDVYFLVDLYHGCRLSITKCE